MLVLATVSNILTNALPRGVTVVMTLLLLLLLLFLAPPWFRIVDEFVEKGEDDDDIGK